jgi:hypothetical protein
MSEQQKPQPDQEPVSEETTILDPATVEYLAMRGAAFETGRRGRAPFREQADVEPPEPDATIENFAERIAEKKQKSKDAKKTLPEKIEENKRKSAEEKKHLGELIDKAIPIAGQMNRRAEEKKKEIEAEAEKAEQEDRTPSIKTNPYVPETTIRYDWGDHKETLRGRKTTKRHEHDYASGWLLARKPIAIDGRLLTQEVLLGMDGMLYAYMRDDFHNSKDYLGEEYSRRQIRASSVQALEPGGGITPIAAHRDHETNAYVRVLSQDENKKAEDQTYYPVLGVVDYPTDPDNYVEYYRKKAISPALVQEGLEDLVVEFGLDPNDQSAKP